MTGELIKADGDIEWNGFLIGSGTPYITQSLNGWYGLPTARVVSTPRPGRHGFLPGELRAGERIIEAELYISDVSVQVFRAAREALAASFAWDENPVEKPLAVRLDGLTSMVQARVLNLEMPTERTYYQGYTRVAIQWAATDPRRYSTTLQQSSTGLALDAQSGLAFPLAFPLDFGPGQSGGSLVLRNAGNTASWPIWQISGPITGPIISDQTTGRSLRFRDSFSLLPGQILRIDTDLGTVKIGNASRRSELSTADWFSINAASSQQIRFSAAEGSGKLTGFCRHAWMT